MKGLIWWLILMQAAFLIGCGVTRSHVSTPDGTECASTTFTLGKDVSGGTFDGCGAKWGVISSDPNAQMAQGMVQMMNFMVPLAIKGMTTP